VSRGWLLVGCAPIPSGVDDVIAALAVKEAGRRRSGRGGGSGGGRAMRVVERNTLAYRRMWLAFVTGLVEPLLFLLSIGIGVGGLVGKVPGPGGQPIPYDQFVAPGLMAAAAMNGAVLDTTFNFFFKFKYAHTYDAMLATPLEVGDVARGELLWALIRGGVYSGAFLVTMVLLGLVGSWWALLALPAAVLVAFGFAGAGIAATTYMRSWTDFDFVNLALIPMFLFAATFFPLSQYPEGLQWVVRCTPLYQGVALERGLTTGQLEWTMVLNGVYLVVMGAVGLRIATRRLRILLQP
jgi:lipooligosaccharide transport system permease protein